MDGGPSHKDTFDLKPAQQGRRRVQADQDQRPRHRDQRALAEAVAKLMNHAAIVRGMSTAEGAHPRAKYYLHTGYREGQGGLVYPTIGAIVSAEVGRADFPLPNFVSIGNRQLRRRLPRAEAPAAHRHRPGPRRRGPGAAVEGGAVRQPRRPAGGDGGGVLPRLPGRLDHRPQDDLRAGRQLMQSKEAKAFDLSLEKAATRPAYGGGRFGDGCLLARRLVEVGVPFVEVNLGGWDTHQDNFDAGQEPVRAGGHGRSPPLVTDLKDRGLLDSTLVIWMGEFGRTPHINARGAKPGRDHYPRAWSLVMFGGGIKGGTVSARPTRKGPRRRGRQDDRDGLPGHRLRADGHRLHEEERDADRPADPDRGQGRQAGQGRDRVSLARRPGKKNRSRDAGGRISRRYCRFWAGRFIYFSLALCQTSKYFL